MFSFDVGIKVAQQRGGVVAFGALEGLLAWVSPKMNDEIPPGMALVRALIALKLFYIRMRLFMTI